MKIKLEGNWQELEEGLRCLSDEIGCELAAGGLPIRVEKSLDGNITIALENGRGQIRFDKKVHFFRALGLFFEATQRSDQFSLTEEPQFTMNGVMARYIDGAIR